jgi:RNA polymerase sigma-70 factor (ECF subfamily)
MLEFRECNPPFYGESMARKTDAQLVEELKRGDSRAFTELVNRHHAKVYQLALKLTRNETDAEDVMQETFLRVYNRIGTFRGEAAFSSWLYRIAANVCFAKLGERRKHEHVDIDEVQPEAEPGPSQAVSDWSRQPDSVLLSKEALEVLDEAISKLPEDFRVVVVLRDIQGLSNSQVADILNLTVAAVKSRLHRARLFLRKELSEYFKRAGRT